MKNVEPKCEFTDPFFQKLMEKDNNMVISVLQNLQMTIQLRNDDLRDYEGEK